MEIENGTGIRRKKKIWYEIENIKPTGTPMTTKWTKDDDEQNNFANE